MTTSFIRWPAARIAAATLLVGSGPAFADFGYVANIDVQGKAENAETVAGVVFHDLSRDGVMQDDEPGVAGVMVTNGREVTTTGQDGTYALPVYDNMTVSVVEPAAWDVPTDENGVPQFFYHHLPDGTPEALRYGGLAPTGPLPEAINFPMIRTGATDSFDCVMMGDTQPYSNTEIGHVRDATLDTILGEDLSEAECIVMLGDVMGDDLSLLPRFMSLFSVAGLPQYYVHGNHDFDFDATTDEHSADSWRQIYGPNYYAFEIGQATFIALDNVVYPCGPEDDGPGGRDACADPTETVYNGRVTDRQMEWLAGILDNTPEDRLIVMLHHIPFVSFIDSNTGRHQTDNLAEIHEMLAGRPAISFSGHTHTFEYLDAGEWYRGWEEQVGVTRLPFPHVIGGAPSGNWYFGDLGFDGTPLSFARGGTPPGFMMVRFDGNEPTVEFRAAGQPADRQMALAFNTPGFRDWFTTIMNWTERRDDEEAESVSEMPPVTVNDLPDTRLMTPEDVAGTVWLTANVWNGGRGTEVFAQIGDGPRMPMERTQAANGEDVLAGAEWADPFSVPRQMTVGRYAWQSTEGDPRAQGFELWQGSDFGPATPQSAQSWMVADQSPHLWRMEMPADLPMGTHVIRVTAIQPDGREFTDHITFEMREERPFPYWDDTLWQDASN
ncbi:calcineurin-like phosphoesterase C-terminal domain-containing protein [Jannaschia aquimarina]|uniref:Cyclic 3',5'-adenosine monophosphate phosphodiesterase n=1 Tax=Jannaschia aquimarina TaxID=935700 RepID=A0A0D1CP60_9RHOB|nr:calcineurin-like phosphoesterase C-terminal domain-containing protein [Jannaschia aquimarina]KIT16557.1 cyclic 3',5'-adenosine monophosphate phosphodiesterase [Jannaschia aquimarina]SNT41857.1 Calcineurin-like phosphoesterase [Jannaschia aquimarina]